jgi:hypothetical protein
VAVTRARVHIAIVCDIDTCSSDPFICDLLDHICLVGEQRSVFEMNYPASDTALGMNVYVCTYMYVCTDMFMYVYIFI